MLTVLIIFHNQLLIIPKKMFNFMGAGDISLKDLEAAIKQLPLPEKIKCVAIYKRYKAIRKVQQEMKEACKAVEKTYYVKDQPILNATADIVSGKRALEKEEIKEPEQYLSAEEIEKIGEHLGARKIDNFWGKCLKQSSIIKNAMGNDDDQLLKSLEKISVSDEDGTDNFTIAFHFSENDMISNEKLEKKFFLKNDQPVKCESSEIEWKGKNLCKKEVKKKQKNKKTGQQRVVTKTVEAKSFFNFFRAIDGVEAANLMDANQEDAEHQGKLEDDFEIGGVIVDEILPFSLEYYLGVKKEDDEDEDFEDDEESDEPEENPKKKKKSAASKSKSKSKGKPSKDKETGKNAGGTEEKPECKQQ